MSVRKIRPSHLARLLNPPATRQAISDLLDGAVAQSRLVPEINRVLGISSEPAPPQSAAAPSHADLMTARLIAAAATLDEETRAELASIAERLARLHAKVR